MSWYDNENSYTSQMVRTIKYFADRIPDSAKDTSMLQLPSRNEAKRGKPGKVQK